MNPVLKKLSAPDQSASQLAVLLEKHIGIGANEQSCSEACDALVRIRDAKTKSDVRSTVELVRANGSSYQEAIEAVITFLRSIDQ